MGQQSSPSQDLHLLALQTADVFRPCGRAVSGAPFGSDIGALPDHVDGLYRESRRASAAGAFTASVLARRKILMNVAVDQGAEEGKRFVEYVEYLADNSYIPPSGKAWVDQVRQRGNTATHEIALLKAEDAEELISIVEMLLKTVYEVPARVTP